MEALPKPEWLARQLMKVLHTLALLGPTIQSSDSLDRSKIRIGCPLHRFGK